MSLRQKTGCTVGILLLVISAALFLPARVEKIAGKTMGTTYHVAVLADGFQRIGTLSEKIDSRLKEINQLFSVFIKDSEISRFNEMTAVGEKFSVSEEFYQVMVQAREIYDWSDHAWDATVMPLVTLWGFGKSGPIDTPPDPEAVAAAKTSVGFDQIQVAADRTLSKKAGRVSLDLASIAKGYGVDAVAKLIRQTGFSNFVVEIGGEVYAAGVRQDGKPWRVGINQPETEASPTAVYRVLPLQDKALATSGDYRNFFEIGNIRYSHIIDPKTGYPVTNGVVSVSVLADNCTLADGLATAIMVMGHEKGLSMVSRLPNVECFIVVRKPDGGFTDYASAGFSLME